MAIVKLIFSEDARGKATKMTLQADGGEVLTLTEPGEVSVEAASSVTVKVTSDESDLFWYTKSISVSVTNTSGQFIPGPMPIVVNGSASISISDSYASVTFRPVMALTTATATLYLALHPTESQIQVSGQKRMLDIVLPKDMSSEDKIYLGWSEIYDGTVTGINPPLKYQLGAVVSLAGASSSSLLPAVGKPTSRLFSTPRNGLDGLYMGYNGQMLRATPYVGKNGQWVPLKTALEIQGYFEQEE